MPTYALRLTVPQSVPSGRSRELFYWSAEHQGTIQAPFGPRLGRLGPVPEPNIDLVRLAIAVFAADRSTPRKSGRSNWSRREFSLTVPVFDPAAWQAITPRLVPLLEFLTGDRWNLDFVLGRSPKEAVSAAKDGIERVVLVSGGADSACGALFSRAELGVEAGQAFVSHLGARNLAGFQRDVVSGVETLMPGAEIDYVQSCINRRRLQIDGARYRNESSSRSRSLLFLSLGLAVASIHGVELWVPENGFASLNPPLGPERRGSLSTRTTHPLLLSELPSVLEDAGVHAHLRNPCERSTKGEMFHQAAELVGSRQASAFLSATHSCAHTGQRAYGISSTAQCGVCFGCLVRRAAFLASGLSDESSYLDPADSRVGDFLLRHTAAAAVRDFSVRGVSRREIASLSLPPGYSRSDAHDLCARAADELRLLPL